jgi:hypothetical protein
MGGNEWATWSKPKKFRNWLITGLLHIEVPLIFTFREREKTKRGATANGKTEIVNIGWQTVAPLEIVHALDLIYILSPRADGVPVWKSDKIGEPDRWRPRWPEICTNPVLLRSLQNWRTAVNPTKA